MRNCSFCGLDGNGDAQITVTEFACAMTVRSEEISRVEIESVFADANSGVRPLTWRCRAHDGLVAW
jgi:hypothetical protein